MKDVEEKVTGRMVICADLRLTAPLLIGQGELYEEGGTDIKVLKDNEGRPYIPGTSLAGILREKMQRVDAEHVELLFGTDGKVKKGDTFQSALNVFDVPLKDADIIVRDGIRIDNLTGVVAEHAKYDFEAVESGATGIMKMEMVLRGFHMDEMTGNLREDVARCIALLAGFLHSGFAAGAKTTVGMGKIRCDNVKFYYYDFQKTEAVQAWLTGAKTHPENDCFLYRPLPVPQDMEQKERFVADIYLSLRSSLLVRSYIVGAKDKNDNISAVPMESKGAYLIPGTSVKGVLRNHANYILRRLKIDEQEAIRMIDQLMGYAPKHSGDEDVKIKSRFTVKEVLFDKDAQGVVAATQRRNKIDRFTGGTIQTALFATKPLWKSGTGSPVHIHFEIEQCNVQESWEAGLALFILKDLCTGNIAVGGEKSVGRGTLQGQKAVVHFGGKTWEIDSCGRVVKGEASELESMAAALTVKGQVTDNE